MTRSFAAIALGPVFAAALPKPCINRGRLSATKEVRQIRAIRTCMAADSPAKRFPPSRFFPYVPDAVCPASVPAIPLTPLADEAVWCAAMP
jgi:hypothetical protein